VPQSISATGVALADIRAPQGRGLSTLPLGTDVVRDALRMFEPDVLPDPFEIARTGDHLKDGFVPSRNPRDGAESRRRVTSIRRRAHLLLKASGKLALPEVQSIGRIDDRAEYRPYGGGGGGDDDGDGHDGTGEGGDGDGGGGGGGGDEAGNNPHGAEHDPDNVGPAVPNRHAPEYYYLTVRVVHTLPLATWRFKVVLTDLVAKRSVTLRNLRVERGTNNLIFDEERSSGLPWCA
jgi:hypothetical protein